MKHLKLLVLLVLTVFGCGIHSYIYTRNAWSAKEPLKIISLYVDKEFTEGDRLSIDNAVSQWNYSMNNYVKLNIVTYYFDMQLSLIQEALNNNGIIIMKINSTTPFLVMRTDGKITLAFVDEIGTGHKLYVIRDRINQENMEGIVLHELGHLLGAEHNNKSYLMQEQYNMDDFQCIDKRSALAVAVYQHIPEDKINYCNH